MKRRSPASRASVLHLPHNFIFRPGAKNNRGHKSIDNDHTSISILNSAEERDFPSASLLKDRDAPPLSALCNTNLSASTLGASKRSTSLALIPASYTHTRCTASSDDSCENV